MILCKMTFIFSAKTFCLVTSTYKRKVFLPVPFNLIRNFRFSQNLTFPEDSCSSNVINFASEINNSQHQYFRHYLTSNSDSYPSIFNPEKISLDCNNRALKLLKEFKTNNENDALALKDINDCLKEDLKNISENDLLAISYVFSNITFHCPKPSAVEIVKTLNNKILEEVYPLSFDKNLRLIDALFSSQFFLNFNYVWKAISKFCYKVESLNLKQVVHLTFLLSKLKKMPTKQAKFHLQNVLNNIAPGLNIIELGIVCYSLQKIQLSISHPELYTTIINVILPNLESLNDHVLTSVSEALSMTKNYHFINSVKNFQENIIPHLNKFKLSTLINVALSGLNLNYVNQQLVIKILDRAKEELPQCDIYLLQRLAFIMAKFNIKNDELIKESIEMVKTKEYNFFIDYYYLVDFTKYLICLDFLDEDLIKKVLAEEKVANLLAKKACRAPKITLGFIDNTVELEMPDYEKPRLSEENKKNILKAGKAVYSSDVKNSLMFSKRDHHNIMWRFQNDLCETYGPDLLEWKKIIYYEPHTLIMRFDKNLALQNIPEEYKSLNSYICKPLDDNHIWVVLLLGSVFTLGVNEKMDSICGSKCRHYEKMGYKPLFMLRNDYLNNSKSKNFKSFFENAVKTHLEKFCN